MSGWALVSVAKTRTGTNEEHQTERTLVYPQNDDACAMGADVVLALALVLNRGGACGLLGQNICWSLPLCWTVLKTCLAALGASQQAPLRLLNMKLRWVGKCPRIWLPRFWKANAGVIPWLPSLGRGLRLCGVLHLEGFPSISGMSPWPPASVAFSWNERRNCLPGQFFFQAQKVWDFAICTRGRRYIYPGEGVSTFQNLLSQMYCSRVHGI